MDRVELLRLRPFLREGDHVRPDLRPVLLERLRVLDLGFGAHGCCGASSPSFGGVSRTFFWASRKSLSRCSDWFLSLCWAASNSLRIRSFAVFTLRVAVSRMSSPSLRSPLT